MNMKMEPIKIVVNPLDVYCKIAFILDQDEFIKEVCRIRKGWGLNNQLIPYDLFDDWYSDHWGSLLPTKEASTYFSSAIDQLEIQRSQGNLDDLNELVRLKELSALEWGEFELNILLKKSVQKDPALRNFLLKAIVCGEINEADWKSRDREITLYGDWLLADSQIYKILDEDYEGDTKQEIERDRKWYWDHKNGKPLGEISQDDSSRGSIGVDEYKVRVKKQINRYKKFLEGHLTTR